MNIVFWLLIIFALMIVWFLVMIAGVPLIRIYMKWLEKEFDEALDENNKERKKICDEK